MHGQGHEIRNERKSFDMMSLERASNRYLGGETFLMCSDEMAHEGDGRDKMYYVLCLQ